MKKEIEVHGYVTLHYDENDKLFQESFNDGFKVSIDKTGTIDDMLKHVAFHVIRFGDDSMVEGVGYVSVFGRKRDESKKPYSGIQVESGYDDFEFE